MGASVNPDVRQWTFIVMQPLTNFWLVSQPKFYAYLENVTYTTPK